MEKPKGIKEYLDYCLEKYFQKVLDKNGFSLTDNKISNMSGLYSYKSDCIEFSLINDRGVVEARLKSIYIKDTSFDFETVNVLMKKLKGEIDKSDRSVFRNHYTKRLNLKDISELFDRNMNFIKELFDQKNIKQTKKALKEIGNERIEFLYGKI